MFYIGEKILQKELNKSFPNGEYYWEGKIIKIESNYIETEWSRKPTYFTERDLANMLKNKLGSNHTTYNINYTKNYFLPGETKTNMILKIKNI